LILKFNVRVDAGGAEITVSVAVLLVDVPAELLTLNAYCAPLSELVLGGVVKELAVAPVITVPLRSHWNDSGPVPAAAPEKVAVWPAITD
jgi:hypothetical protein